MLSTDPERKIKRKKMAEVKCFCRRICSGLVVRLTTATQFPVIFHRLNGEIPFRNRHAKCAQFVHTHTPKEKMKFS